MVYSAWWLLALEKGGMKGGTSPVVAFFLECTRDKPRNLFSATLRPHGSLTLNIQCSKSKERSTITSQAHTHKRNEERTSCSLLFFLFFVSCRSLRHFAGAALPLLLLASSAADGRDPSSSLLQS